MLSPPRAWCLLLMSLAFAGGCKKRENPDQDSRPLPTPEPPASPTSAGQKDDAGPKSAVTEDAKERAAKAKRAAAEASAKAPSATAPGTAVATPTASVAAATASAPAAAPPPAPIPTTLPSAPTFTAPSAACLSRCQGALQGCLSQPVDGGVPGFANLDICKKAFEACQAACK